MKFRKKPVEVEAFRITMEFLRIMRGTVGDHIIKISGDIEYHKDHVIIQTLEGQMRGELGDWIITGINGEKYPCKPDIFNKTYEKVKETKTEKEKSPCGDKAKGHNPSS